MVDEKDCFASARMVAKDCTRAGFTPMFRYAPSLEVAMLWIEAGIGVGFINTMNSLTMNPNITILDRLTLGNLLFPASLPITFGYEYRRKSVFAFPPVLDKIEITLKCEFNENQEVLMNSQQKFDHAMTLKPFARKQDIPVFPHICTYAAIPAGVTQAQLFTGNAAWMDAYRKTCEIAGYPDVAFPLGSKTVTYIEQMKVRIPGRDLSENELFQFVEEEIMSQEDYKVVIEKGFGAWQTPFVASIQNPPFTGPFAKWKVLKGFIGSGL